MLKGLGPRPPAATLLGAQAVAHGLLCILTIVPAAGLFLSSYGAARLPYVYIAVALVGMGSAPLVARSLSRRPIVAVARPILLGIAFLHLGCWVVIERWHAAWPAVIVQLLLPMTLQIGFVFLGSQAGRLLTVREMKAWFSLIATGFSVALLFGGIVAPLLVDLLGRTHHLLVLTAMSAGLMLWLISITYRRYPDQLAMTPIDPQRSFPDAPTPDGAPVRQLIVLIFAYQIFSSLGTQFGEFFLFDRAAARYASSEELARFAAHYNVGLNLVEILVLGVVAGPLLARFGLRFGLFANPSVLLVGFVAAAVVAPIAGVGSFAMLLAATAARTGDITLTNSTTRTATNTAYQALPYAVRPSVQARTEGVAVPAAIGLSGVILLAIDQFGGAVEALIAVSIVTCVGWLLATTLLYSRYRGQLHENLAHRVLTPRMVPLGDAGTDALIELVLHDAVVDQGDATRLPTSHFSGSDPRTLSRQIRSTPDDLRLVDALVDVVRHGPRQVRALTLRRLSGLLEKGDPRRGELAACALEAAVLMRFPVRPLLAQRAPS